MSFKYLFILLLLNHLIVDFVEASRCNLIFLQPLRKSNSLDAKLIKYEVYVCCFSRQ